MLSFQPQRFVAPSQTDDCKNDKICKSGESVSSLTGDKARRIYEEVLQIPTSFNSNEAQEAVSSAKITQKKTKCILPVCNSGAIQRRGPKWSDRAQFYQAATEGSLPDVKRHLQSVGVDARDQFDWTPLMLAAFAGHAHIVKYLKKKGADKYLTNQRGQTAEDLAGSQGFLEIVEILRNKKRKKKKCKSKRAREKVSEYCHHCKMSYTDPGHETSTVHVLNTTKPSENPGFLLDPGNPGYRLMVQSGWDEKSGLGSEKQGRHFPIKTRLKRDRKGLGLSDSDKDKPRVTHFGPYDKEAVKMDKEHRKKLRGLKKIDKKNAKEKERRERAWVSDFRREFYDFDTS